jgi:hypothetical protein
MIDILKGFLIGIAFFTAFGIASALYDIARAVEKIEKKMKDSARWEK